MSDTVPPGSAPHAYPKISAKERIDGRRAADWVATEKVHGAHFAVVCDAAGVRPAKRRELLPDDALDGFFGVSRLWPAVAVAATRCAVELRATYGPAAGVTLYGELAGGRYPHPDVAAVAGAQPVQTGVWYAPDLFWLVFDALVTADGRRLWAADRVVRAAAEAAGLACVPVRGRGPLERLLELPSLFASEVPAGLGLPPIAGNLAEGYVLKPAGEWDADADPRPVRKVKQKAFAEDERYAGARPHLAPPDGAAGVPAWLVVRAAALLTPARAAGAVSKLGPGAGLAAVAAEIAGDAAEEVAAEVGGLDAAQLGSLAGALLPGARRLAAFDAADRRSACGRHGARK